MIRLARTDAGGPASAELQSLKEARSNDNDTHGARRN
jgi:hypothetical protein